MPRPSNRALFETYGIEPNFNVRYLSVAAGNGRRDPRMLMGLFRRHLLGAMRRDGPPVVISSDVRLLLPYVAVARMRRPHVLTAPWLHDFRNKRLERLVCANSACVLATNPVILHELASSGISNARTFVTGNPVPQERVEFGRACPREDARRRLRLDLRQPVVAYTGKLYLGMRELDHILAAAARLPEFLFLLTGGQPAVIEALTEQLRNRAITNVRFAGILGKPEETRFYQQAANVLVAYYSRQDHPQAHNQLPNKLAEYMTTGNPIVAANFPAVRDVLSSENAVLIDPDNVDLLTDALAFVIRSPELAAALGARAQRDVAARTTESVGAELSDFLTLGLESSS